MRLIFFGTGEFAIPALQEMAGSIILAVTQPDRPSGRGMKLQPSPVKVLASELGIPVETPEKCRAPEFVEAIASLEADALLVASYGQILSQRLLDSAKRGGINLHGSILPRWRGAAPIQRAILHQDSETGVTLMQMDKGMDTGDIIHIESTPIGSDETYGELQHRLSIMAANMAKVWMPRICAGDYQRTPQDSSQASLAPKIEGAERELEFGSPADAMFAKIRAFSPAPGAFLPTRFGKLKVHRANLGTNHGEPGVVLGMGQGLEIAVGDGSLELHEVQLEGTKRMSGRDFANGMRIKAGDSLR